jgi:hypothetical protein
LRLSLYGIVLAAARPGVRPDAHQQRLLPAAAGARLGVVVRNMPPLVFIFIFYFISSQITPPRPRSDRA